MRRLREGSMAKKKKRKKKKRDHFDFPDVYKKPEYDKNYNSTGSAYKRMFKDAPGKLKIFEFAISKKETLKIKMKYNKKKGTIVVLSPFPKSRGGRITYCIDLISMYVRLWDFVRIATLEKAISKKKKFKATKILEEHTKLETKFLLSINQLDFVKKAKKKKDAKSSKRKTDKASKRSKKSKNK